MCEYCGCQQVAAIAELTREHDAVVALAGQIQNALSGQRRREVTTSCRQMLALLASHTVVEEEGLFAEMTHDFPDHIKVLSSEHREVEKVLGEAADGFPQDPTWPDRLVSVLSRFCEHIRTEQDGVFPAALVAFDVRQWDRIEAVRAKARTASRTMPARAMQASEGDCA